MPTGPERLVLAACDELAGHGHGFVLDSDVAEHTGMGLGDVRDCLLGLGRVEYVDLARLGDDSLKAAVTPKGRQGLITDGPGTVFPPSVAHRRRQVNIVPKGLRSFDEEDKDFFLQLLPGPFRDGLPESIHFWKSRIEENDPDRAFRVGLISGLSGCGKSSMVKAGLLPRLAPHVLTIFIRAASNDTESRLLRELRKGCPNLPLEYGLVESLSALCSGQTHPTGHKVLIVIDQFEQWLHSKSRQEDTELVAALRLCDGSHVQTIVLVRDEFWMATNRFEVQVGVEFRRTHNSYWVDLFEQRHARKVLEAFGRAYEVLEDKPTKDQQAFLDQAVEDMAQDGKVIPVNLALLAEMVRSKPWSPKSLKQVGGAKGLGVSFLEETFESPNAPPKYRQHIKAIQVVLKALLPESVLQIKGRMRSQSELQEATSYVARPIEIEEAIRILDAEVRLITPALPEESDEDLPRQMVRYYQLTHDYLVPSIRDWLARKQKETRRGRAEILLMEHSALWNTKPQNRYLPSRWDYCRIRLLTRRQGWSEPQQKMMKKAGKAYGAWGLGLAAVVAGLVSFGLYTYSAGLVQQLRNADTARVPSIVRSMRDLHLWTDPALKRTLRSKTDGSDQKLKASLALLDGGDRSQLTFLEKRLHSASSADLSVLRDALKPHRTQLIPQLWTVLQSTKPDDTRLLPAASALAIYDPDSPHWAEVSGKVAQAVVLVNSIYLKDWLDLLRPVRGKLTAPLAMILGDSQRPESDRTQATSVLSDYAGEDLDLLGDLLLGSEERPFAVLFERLRAHRERAVALMQSELAKKGSSDASEVEKDTLTQRQARAALVLLRLGQVEKVWPLLRHSSDPSVRSYIVNWLKPLGADSKSVMTRLEDLAVESLSIPKEGKSRTDDILFHTETSERRALILALGEYDVEELSPGDREPLVAMLLKTYRTDPDAGIHGAAEWTLRRWKKGKMLENVDVELPKLRESGDRRWYVNDQGQTFAVIAGPVNFMMGSPTSEFDRYEDEVIHRKRIGRSFAIATKEVTVEQFQRFLRSVRNVNHTYTKRISPDKDGPQISVTWYEAAAYCNWLSQQEGLKCCYEPNKQGEFAEGMRIVLNPLEQTGYRLPTEAEWEYSTRAGARTSRYFGAPSRLLGKYAWYTQNSDGRAWACGLMKPNDFGLFDTMGNVYEWCHDRLSKYIEGDDLGGNYSPDGTELLKDKDIRLLRDGAFTVRPQFTRSAYRDEFQPSVRISNEGFRLARTLGR
jgi:formylglycine-generating enzyme required for sulfatase activity